MKKKLWIAAGVIAGLVVIGSLAGGSEGDDSPKSEATSEPAKKDGKESEAEPTSEPDGLTDEVVEASFVEAMGGQEIDSMCDAAYTHWACFYEGVEAMNDSTIRVKLATDGGWSDGDLEDLSDEAARHWFNFLHAEYEDLGTVVVQTNGLARNHRKGDYPHLG